MNKNFIPLYVIISIALFFIGAFVSANIPALQSLLGGTTLYTPAMMEDIKEDAYNQGVLDKETLMREIATYKSSLEKVTAERNSLQEELTQCKQNCLLNEDIISELEAQIEAKNQTISDLEYQVSYYEELLEAYFDIDKISVSFKVDNEVIDVQLVESGDCAVETVSPTKQGYEFLGWTIDGENIVDILTYPITEDVTFIAKFEYVASWKVLTDDVIAVISSNMSFNPLNKTVEVADLKTTDTFRVTFSTFAILDDYDSAGSTWYYVGEGNGYSGGNFAYDWNGDYKNNLQDIILTSGETYTFENKISSGLGTLIVSCTEDGVLKLEGSITNDLVYFADMTISKIEVYK